MKVNVFRLSSYTATRVAASTVVASGKRTHFCIPYIILPFVAHTCTRSQVPKPCILKYCRPRRNIPAEPTTIQLLIRSLSVMKCCLQQDGPTLLANTQQAQRKRICKHTLRVTGGTWVMLTCLRCLSLTTVYMTIIPPNLSRFEIIYFYITSRCITS
jgi:hypothetical protein